MVRRFIAVAGTLSLVACAAQSADDGTGTSSHLIRSADVPVTVIDNGTRMFSGKRHPEADVAAVVRSQLALDGYREAKVEEIPSADGTSHLVVQLLVEGEHAMKLARIDVDPSLVVQSVTEDYARSAEDESHGTTAPTYVCPDPTVQFVSICPNNNTLEINITNEVADAAEAAGLKTVRLLKRDATHDAWLNYMACPNLIGNFYDGDANPSEVVVYNGAVTAREFAASTSFNLETTNIWLACQAYKDPMLTAVEKTAKSQKYAAGINNLAVGPSDRAAACTMKAAILGQPMTDAFQTCYHQLDTTSDHWGFGGDGSDTFGQSVAPAPVTATTTTP